MDQVIEDHREQFPLETLKEQIRKFKSGEVSYEDSNKQIKALMVKKKNNKIGSMDEFYQKNLKSINVDYPKFSKFKNSFIKKLDKSLKMENITIEEL